MSRARWGRIAAAAALLATSAACARDAGVVHVRAEDLAAQIVASVSADLGVTPQVTCPEDLPGIVGTTAQCDLVIGESAATAVVTVTEVTRDDEVRFDIAVDGVTELPEESPTPTEAPTSEETPAPAETPAPEESPGAGETPGRGPTIPGTPQLPNPPIPIPSVDQTA